MPWLVASLQFMSTIFVYHLIRNREVEKRQSALSGLVPKEVLEKISRGGVQNFLRPVGRNVSIMFIDIVGFSLTTERLQPDEAFRSIKAELNAIIDKVHSLGGIIDKTLGDGLLCFFGYDLYGGESSQDHALHSMNAALEIQMMSYRRCLAAASDQPIYPLRIGINSGLVYIGDIGSAQRRDITMIGDEVNFAARLESACEPFKIMVGAETYSLIKKSDQHCYEMFNERFIKIKHHLELISAWEIDPFFDASEKLHQIRMKHKKYQGRAREDLRADIGKKLKFWSNIGLFTVCNMSSSGFAFMGDTFLARGVIVSLKLDGEANDELVGKGLSPFTVEIRWGEKQASHFVHGAKIVGFNDTQTTMLIATIRSILSES